MPKLVFSASAMELDCTMLPMPKPAMPANSAKVMVERANAVLDVIHRPADKIAILVSRNRTAQTADIHRRCCRCRWSPTAGHQALKGVMSPASGDAGRTGSSLSTRTAGQSSRTARRRGSMPHTIPFTVPTNSVIASISRSFRQMRLRAFRNETGNDTEVRGNAPDHTAGSRSDLLPPPATNCPDTSISTADAGGRQPFLHEV